MLAKAFNIIEGLCRASVGHRLFCLRESRHCSYLPITYPSTIPSSTAFFHSQIGSLLLQWVAVFCNFCHSWSLLLLGYGSVVCSLLQVSKSDGNLVNKSIGYCHFLLPFEPFLKKLQTLAPILRFRMQASETRSNLSTSGICCLVICREHENILSSMMD